MTKKILCVLLSIVMIASTLAVGSFAADTDWKKKVDKVLVGEIYYEWLHGRETTDEELAEIIAKDPDVLERNLYFWSDEVIEAYRSAQTNEDWQALYHIMAEQWLEKEPQFPGVFEPYSYEEYWPLEYRPQKAVVEVTYSTDVDHVKVGDTITVTAKASTNFYTFWAQYALYYDKTLVTCTGTSNYSPDPTWECLTNLNYGIRTDGTDVRKYIWPISWRDNNNGEYDQYQIMIFGFSPDGNCLTQENYQPSVKFDDQVIFTATFTVNEGVADGTEIPFFAITGSSRILEDEDFHEMNGSIAMPFQQAMCIGPGTNRFANEINQVDHTYIYNNASVIVGEEAAVEYADYTELDSEIEEFDETVAADYVASLWADYKAAVEAGEALARDILKADQRTVDAVAANIADTKAALVKNSVISAEVVGAATIGTEATVDVVVTGSPELLRLTGDGTLTFSRNDATIIAGDNGSETWKIKVFATEETANYEVYAKYANYTENGVAFTITASEGPDLSIHSIEIPDAYPNSANGDVVYAGRHDIIIKTSTDVWKIQFVDTNGTIEAGCTYTYTTNIGGWACEYTDDEETGERTWVINHNFGPYGTWSMPIRTRSESTLFATTGDVLSATVVY